MTKSLRAELLIVLTLTFGISGVRAVLNLINSLASPHRLNEQSVTLNSSQSSLAWVDMGLQLCSAAVLFSYGALALFLLAKDHIVPRPHRTRDWLEGAGLAALIGIPGLARFPPQGRCQRLRGRNRGGDVAYDALAPGPLVAASHAGRKLHSPRFLPPLPGYFRWMWQYHHGVNLRLLLPPHGAGMAFGHSAFSYRRRRFRGLFLPVKMPLGDVVKQALLAAPCKV